MNLTDPSVTRKEELKEGYMFECKCTLCDEPEYSDMLMRSMRCDFCKPVPCVQPIEDVMVDEEWTGRFKKHYPGTYILIWWEAYLKPCQTSMMKLFAKIVNDLLTFLNPWYAHGWNIVVTSGLVYGILLSRLGWCPQLLLGIVRQTAKTDMQDCWSFTCYFYWTLGSSSKCGQLKSFL